VKSGSTSGERFRLSCRQMSHTVNGWCSLETDLDWGGKVRTTLDLTRLRAESGGERLLQWTILDVKPIRKKNLGNAPEGMKGVAKIFIGWEGYWLRGKR